MVRKKLNTPRKRGNHKAEDMLRGLILHRQGLTIRRAAKASNLCYATLYRYIKNYASVTTKDLKNQRLTPQYKINMIFTAEQEAELAAYVKDLAATNPKNIVSSKEIRKAAYELAAVNNLETPVNWHQQKMAGVEWLRSFKERNLGPKKKEVVGVNVDAMEAVVKELTQGKTIDGEELYGDVEVKKEVSELTDEGKLEANLSDDDDMLIMLDDAGEDSLDSLSLKEVAGATEEVFEGTEEFRQDPLDNKDDAEVSNDVWNFFERQAGHRARCVACRATFPAGAVREMRAHLRTRHPKLVAEADLGSDEAASDTQDDVYTEVVYLEDEQNAKPSKNNPKKKLKPKTERSERKRHPSSSSDEVPLKQKKKLDEKQDDEIEQFGKYVTCLLRKIPPSACMELQAEIVNLIMRKQLELKRNETSLLAGTDKMAEVSGSVPSTSNNVEYSNETEDKV